MTYKFSNNVSTLLYEELSPKASEMKVYKLPEGIRWPIINTAEKEVAPCTVIDPRTRAWEIMYIKEIIEGPTYDTLKITRGEEETGPNFFNKKSRVEIRVTAAVLNDYYAMQVATPTRKGIVQVGERLDVTSDGILSVPLATTTTEGAVKVGDRLLVDDEGTVSVPVATDEVSGVIKVGDNLAIDAEGTLSVPNASTSEAGVVKLSDSFSVDDDGNLVLPIATITDTGVIKIGESLTIADDGTADIDISAIIDDTQTSSDSSWSSDKIQEEVDKVAGVIWNKRVDSIPEDTSDITDDMPIGGLVVTPDDNEDNPIAVLQAELDALKEDVKKRGIYNTEEWITESGTWIVPVTGWYEVTAIGGGMGGWSRNDSFICTIGGWSGSTQTSLIYLNAADSVSVVIGTGSLGVIGSTDTRVHGGVTSFGNFSSNAPYITRYSSVQELSGNGGYAWSPGAGPGGGSAGIGFDGIKGSGQFYGAGGTASVGPSDIYTYVGNGVQGAVHLRYYDPSKEETE